jgi:hypothetical protein
MTIRDRRVEQRFAPGDHVDGRKQKLCERGIEVEALPTGEAVLRYGALDRKRTAARAPPHLRVR